MERAEFQKLKEWALKALRHPDTTMAEAVIIRILVALLAASEGFEDPEVEP